MKRIYLSPIGLVISVLLNILAVFRRPFMVYGYYNRITKRYHKYTRVSSTVDITDRSRLDIADHVWIGHYGIIDSSNGISIERGCQLSPHVCIFTHGSHISIRLLGDHYLEASDGERVGYERGPVAIGEYTYVGAQAIIFPGVTIGRGCVIGAKSLVTKNVPDFAVVMGVPAKIVGDTRTIDRPFYDRSAIAETYYDSEMLKQFLSG